MDIIDKNIRKAYKAHQCAGCLAEINKGNRYADITFADGDISHTRLCPKCFYVWQNNIMGLTYWDDGWAEGELEAYHDQVPDKYELPDSI